MSSNQVPFSLKLLRLAFKMLGPIFPKSTSEYLYRNVWLTPPRYQLPEREIPYAKKAERKTILVDNKKVQIYLWGQGPTILFVHGWGGRGTQASAFIDGFLAAGFSVMALDLPAHGDSEGKQANPYSHAKALSLLISQMDNLHSIVTHSFGGMILSYCYKQQAIPLKKIVLICPPSTLQTPLNHFANFLQLSKKLQDSLKIRILKELGSETIKQMSVCHNVEQIIQPMLIVHDTTDQVVPICDGQEVANHAPSATIKITEGLGHHRILHDSETVKSIQAFIQN